MSPTPSVVKQVEVKVTTGTTNDPVTVKNNTTGEYMIKDRVSGKLMRLSTHAGVKQVLINVDNFVEGWIVGDILTVSIGGLYAGTSNVTLTAATERQTLSITATAVSTAVLSI